MVSVLSLVSSSSELCSYQVEVCERQNWKVPVSSLAIRACHTAQEQVSVFSDRSRIGIAPTLGDCAGPLIADTYAVVACLNDASFFVSVEIVATFCRDDDLAFFCFSVDVHKSNSDSLDLLDDSLFSFSKKQKGRCREVHFIRPHLVICCLAVKSLPLLTVGFHVNRDDFDSGLFGDLCPNRNRTERVAGLEYRFTEMSDCDDFRS